MLQLQHMSKQGLSIAKSKSDKGLGRSIPHNIKPMMATLVAEPFDRKDWIFEVKWDGDRAITEIEKGKIKIYSRNNKDYSDRFSNIYDSFVDYTKDAIFDGEIVALDDSGRSDFQLLQNYQSTGKGKLVYYIFDLLYYDRQNLMSWTLEKRRQLLKKIIPKKPNVKFSDSIPEKGKAFFELISKHGLEGMVAKSLNSTYKPGKRSTDWLKVKAHSQQEVIVCGYTPPKGSRLGFGALILGVYDNDQLIYIGSVGTGFDKVSINNLMKTMEPIIIRQPLFSDKQIPKGITWLKPQLVGEIKFQEWTANGLLRQPVFLGLRDDKDPKDVKKEITNEKRQIIYKGLEFNNPNKIFWSKLKITKGDLMNYYLKVSKYLLPHLVNRPESLNRFPDGINGIHFFQKNVDDQPKWMKTYHDISGEDNHDVNYVICNDIRTLVYIINLGCVDLNVWNSRIRSSGRPDFMVFDLDPVGIEFRYVLETALVIHDILKSIGIVSYPKTSGKRGLHIYVPLAAKYTYDRVRDFAYSIAQKVNQKLPEITSLERMPMDRQNRVYLDYLQNHETATMAAPYSVRPVEPASVSTPVTWKEIKKGFKPSDFTIYNLPQRLTGLGDIFYGVLGKGIDLEKSLNKFKNLK